VKAELIEIQLKKLKNYSVNTYFYFVDKYRFPTFFVKKGLVYSLVWYQKYPKWDKKWPDRWVSDKTF
jgi:hypothetical protein